MWAMVSGEHEPNVFVNRVRGSNAWSLKIHQFWAFLNRLFSDRSSGIWQIVAIRQADSSHVYCPPKQVTVLMCCSAVYIAHFQTTLTWNPCSDELSISRPIRPCAEHYYFCSFGLLSGRVGTVSRSDDLNCLSPWQGWSYGMRIWALVLLRLFVATAVFICWQALLT